MKKCWKGLLTALFVLPFLVSVFGLKTVQAAAPEDQSLVNITVNKRVWKDTKPSNTLNTGQVMEDFGGTPLNGVGFTIYDVTAAYHDAIEGTSQTAAIQAILADESSLAIPANLVGPGEQLTTGVGQATFTVPLKSHGKDAVYLITESSLPNTPTIIEKAQPIVLAMPIYTEQGATGTLNRDIYVYPKNVKAENEKIFENQADFSDVTIGDQTYKSVNVGDILNYKLKINVPVNFDIHPTAGLTTYVIKDTPAAGLALTDIDDVVVGDLTKDTDYVIAENGGGFAITLKQTEATKRLRGHVLEITYDMALTADVIPDTGLQNNATVELNGQPTDAITPPTGVSTGGIHFVKTDDHTDKGLSGASFVVKNSIGQFASFTGSGPYVFAGWKTTEAQATHVSSSTNGLFTIQGLQVGDYQLIETVAPDGYVLNTNPVPFSITASSYTQTTEVGTQRAVPNTPKGLLPSTGGHGIYYFLIIGAMLMSGAYLWFRKSKVQAEV